MSKAKPNYRAGTHLFASYGAAFRLFVRRLAPYNPFAPDHRGAAVRKQLILATAHECDGRLSSCTECQSYCCERWGVELERDEISRAIGELIDDRKLIKETTSFKLAEETEQELARRILKAREDEAAALTEWESDVRRTEPDLGAEQVSQLREDLTAWIHRIIVERGIEAAVLLYPEEERLTHRLKEIKARGFGWLPKRDPSVMLARPRALRGFFDHMTSTQRLYFGNLMSTAYLMSAFTLDPGAFDEVKKLTNGQRLYLDTNIVYSLLKLNGQRMYMRAKRILMLSRLLGYETCVTPWTVEEMRISMRPGRAKLARRLPPASISDLTLTTAGEEDEDAFVTAARRAQREKGTSFEDFFARLFDVPGLLRVEGVEVVSEGCREVEDELKANPSRLNQEIEALERVRDRDAKSRPVQEHDVKHRLLIERLRGAGERRMSDVGYLLLTYDHWLVRYAALKDDREMPFAKSMASWGAFVRSLTPRTSDYDETMMEMLDTPAICASGLGSQKDVINAIDHINQQERLSPSGGARFWVDASSNGKRNIEDSGRYERARGIPSVSESSLEAQVSALEEQLASEHEARVAKDTEIRRLRGALVELNARLGQMAAERARGMARASDRPEDTASAHPDHDYASPEEVRALRSHLALYERACRATIAIVGVAAITVPASTGWATGKVLVAVILGGLAGLVWAVAWRERARASAAIILVAAILGIIGAVEALVSKPSHGGGTSSNALSHSQKAASQSPVAKKSSTNGAAKKGVARARSAATRKRG